MDTTARFTAVVKRALADAQGEAAQAILDELDKLDGEIRDQEERCRRLGETIAAVSGECTEDCYSAACADDRCTCPCTGTCAETAGKERAELQAELAQAEGARETMRSLRRDLESLTGDDDDWAIVAPGWLFGPQSVTPPVTQRPCVCGCGQPVTSPRPEAKYATGACRVRAHRDRAALT
jgi:hypothetical protein